MKYVFLGKFSPAWASKQKQRLAAGRAKARDLGIKIEGVFYTQGEYDFVDIVDAKDATDVLAFSLWYAQQGYGRIVTLPAFDGPTIEAAVKKL